MKKYDVKSFTFETIDVNMTDKPEMTINLNNVSFTKRVLDLMGYPGYVQYCVDAGQRIFALRVCKGNESRAAAFSKPREEQTTVLSTANKNICETAKKLIENFNPKKRYIIEGFYDKDEKIMIFDMKEAKETASRCYKKNREE